jgi:DNA polymerase-1
MKKLYLVDVSNYIFRSYFALPPMSNERGEATHALYGFIRSIFKLINDFKVTHMAAVFDGPGGSVERREIYKEYKAHRKPCPEDLPHQIVWAKEFCELAGIPIVEVEGVEADDSMGTIANKMAKKDVHVYLCSSDKDLAQIVNGNISILNTFKDNLILDGKGVEKTYGVRPDQIIDYLAIMGDASDNIPGLPGFGPKTAQTLLAEFDTLDYILDHPDEIPGKKKQETIREQAQLALVSRELATIDLEVPVPGDQKFYEVAESNPAHMADFYRDKKFNTLLREVSSGPEKVETKKGNYTIVDDEGGLKKLIDKLKSAKEFAFDTETTDLRPMQAEMVGIGFCIKEGEAVYVPCNGVLGLDRVIEAIKPLFKTGHCYAQNAKYDIHVLENHGVQVNHLDFDTMIASYLLNSHDRRHGLDHLALTYFNKVKTPISDLIGTGKKQKSMLDVPIEEVGPYCCEDVDYTLRLKHLFEPQIKKRKLETVFYEIEMPLVPILVQMERNGIYADVKQLHRFSEYLVEKITGLEGQIHKLAGENFNVGSPKQLSDILFNKLGIKPPKKTATGYSTSADVLESLADEYPIAEKVIEYRTLEKLRSTYADTLPEQVNPNTGRIHCTFNQSIARTGRLSSTDPNLQNIPVRTEEGRKIRAAFKPQEAGWSYLSGDYSQIELRLLAHLSEDPHLLKAFKNGDDIHEFTASLIFGVPKVTKEQRHRAKAVNFGILYGQSAFGLSRQLGISPAEAKAFIKAYFERFSHVRDYIEASKEEARQTGVATSIMGRERQIPEINGRNAIARQAAERLAVNTPLQGSSADITKMAMIDVAKEIEGKTARMLIQIHDELVFEAPDKELSPLKSLVKNAMERVIELKVPLVVDISVGKNWKEC